MKNVNKIKTVTDGKVTKSQPIVCTSFTTSSSFKGCILSVTRHYDYLKNNFGGLGRIKKLDGCDKWFSTKEEAKQYAYEHGYLNEYFISSDLKKRKRENYKKIN